MDRVSDRGRAQLRGAVKTIVDGSTKTEYDRLGNVLSWRIKQCLRFVRCVKKKMSSRAHRHAVAKRYCFCSHSDRKSLEA